MSAVVARRVSHPDGVELPAVTYKRISTVPDIDLSDVGIRQARFEFNCWAEDYLTTLTVAGLLGALLEFSSPPGTSIDRILPDGAGDHHEETAGLYRRSIDFLIFEQ